jgi:tRNA(Ile)-lysidine synthase
LLVAVSGGSDSTALLRLACDTRERHGRRLVVAHVHHGIRPDADEEAARLETVCARLGLLYRCVRLDPARCDEASLRILRREALRRIADEEGCRFILLGHQRDDQAETILLHLLRGTGTAGLRGMRLRRGRLVRPLLPVSREALRSYLLEVREEWTEDPTNLDRQRLRNRIRLELLPAIEDLRAGSVRAMARAAAHIAQVDDEIARSARRELRRCRLPGLPGEVLLDARKLRGYHRSFALQIVRHAVRIVRGDTSDISAPLWKSIVATHAVGRAGRFDLRRGTFVQVMERVVRISMEPRVEPLTRSVEAPWYGMIRIGEGRQAEHECVPNQPGLRLRLTRLSRGQVFDADGVRPPLHWRGLRPGDRLRRPGAAGSRKVFDLMGEMGIPASIRAQQPVLEDADGILWVPGVRRAGRAEISGSTRRLWIVRWSGELPADRRLSGGTSRCRGTAQELS